MTFQEIKQKRFEKILGDALKQTNEGLTREEFVQAFKTVLEIVRDIKNTNKVELAKILKQIEDTAATTAQELRDTTTTGVDALTRNVLAEIHKALKEQENGMKFIYDKVGKLKSIKGDTGDAGLDAPPVNHDIIIQEVLRRIPKPKDGRNPMTVSSSPPLNPEIGDLWYQP